MPFVVVEIEGIGHDFISATGFSETSGAVTLTRNFNLKDMGLADWFKAFESGTAVQKDISILLPESHEGRVDGESEGGRRNLFGCLPSAYEISDAGMKEQTESICLKYKDAQWG